MKRSSIPGSARRLSSALGLALACALAFALGLWAQRQQGDPEPSVAAAVILPTGILWPDPKPVSPFVLQDHRGEDFGLGQLSGRWSFLFFGYTHCPDICPITLGLMGESWQALAEELPDRRAQMIFVTLDPARDDSQTLMAYLGHFHQEFIGLGGPLPAVLDFAKQLGIPYAYQKVEGSDDYHVDHPGSLFLLDDRARLVGVFHPPHKPQEIRARFAAIAHFIRVEEGAHAREDLASSPLGAPSKDPASVRFSSAWISVPPPGARVAAGYLTIHNPSDKDLHLVSVQSRDFEAVEIHESIQSADHVMRMRRLPSLVIPADGEQVLSPDGYHLMLKVPRRLLQEGDEVQVNLHFASGRQATLSVPVRGRVL